MAKGAKISFFLVLPMLHLMVQRMVSGFLMEFQLVHSSGCAGSSTLCSSGSLAGCLGQSAQRMKGAGIRAG